MKAKLQNKYLKLWLIMFSYNTQQSTKIAWRLPNDIFQAGNQIKSGIECWYQSKLRQSDYLPQQACLHETVNLVVFFVKSNETSYPKEDYACKCTELSLKRKAVCISIVKICLDFKMQNLCKYWWHLQLSMTDHW